MSMVRGDASNIVNEILAEPIRAKEKVSLISQHLLEGKVSIDVLIQIAKKESDVNKASIIEAMEYASRAKSEIIDKKSFEFVIESLKSEAARIKWESARVIANSAHMHPKMLKNAIGNLLANTEHPGAVVRWSAAGALSKIIQCKTSLNRELIPVIEAIEMREEDNAIRKIYRQGLKKAAK